MLNIQKLVKPENTETMFQEDKIKVSVVIPCYNVGKYLKKCIESVLAQTLREIEIIAVDDGSTDNTGKLLDDYKEIDSRFTVIHQKNGGYGKAVNHGISKAKGEYIGIVESDDFISEDMYERLYDSSFNGTVDVVKTGFYDYYEVEGEIPTPVRNEERNSMPEMKKPAALKQIPQILEGHPSVWSAIYRREFLGENHIVFKEASGGGWVDNPFFFETVCKAKKIFWLNEPLYYYRKTNPNSSSNRQANPVLPFERMEDNLDIIEKNGSKNDDVLKRVYDRAFMYLRGALAECDYDNNYDIINSAAQKLMRRLDADFVKENYNLQDQNTFFEFASPLKTMRQDQIRILLYNWLPFDNPWGWGGGVTIYCKNVIDMLLKEYPNASIYFLSSGFAYNATTTDITYRRIGNIFGERVQQYEIVNSPVPADQRNIYNNPLIAIENKELKDVFKKFIDQFGPFCAIHFNNIEGISFDILDLKEEFPETKFLYSIHNYVPMCVTGSYYMRHKHCNCNPLHTGKDCFLCVHSDIESKFAQKTYERGFVGVDRENCVSQNRFCKKLGFDRLDQTVYEDEILQFAQAATKKINKNCDHILAVSQRVYDIGNCETSSQS